MNNSVRIFILVTFLLTFFSAPFFSFGVTKDFSPEEPENWSKIFSAVKRASEKTKNIRNKEEVRSALILGILNQESGYGKNLGKTKNGWKSYCEKEINKNKKSCIYWELYDCKSDYSNVGELIKKGEKEERINYFEEICNTLEFNIETVKTSFTCALGFTQFEPNTWWDIKKRNKKDILLNPWAYYDSILASSYKLKEDGAPENEKLALTKYYGAADDEYIKPILNTAKQWENNFLKPTAETFCNSPSDFSCALEKLKAISEICYNNKEKCNLYEIKKELRDQIAKKGKLAKRPLLFWKETEPVKSSIEEKSLFQKIKDVPQNISESISKIFEEKKKQVENIIERKITEIQQAIKRKIESAVQQMVQKQMEEMERACAIKAVYEESPELNVLRNFRDEFLFKKWVGKIFVHFYYYHFSPPIAQFLSDRAFLKGVTREAVVKPIVYTVRVTQGVWDKN